jgi:hypothetical protein
MKFHLITENLKINLKYFSVFNKFIVFNLSNLSNLWLILLFKCWIFRGACAEQSEVLNMTELYLTCNLCTGALLSVSVPLWLILFLNTEFFYKQNPICF